MGMDAVQEEYGEYGMDDSPYAGEDGEMGEGEMVEEEDDELEQIDQSVTCMALHPKLPLLALGCSPDIIKIWHLTKNTFVSGIRHSGRLTALAFSPDGNMLASAASWECLAVGWTHSIRLWTLHPKSHQLAPAQGLVGQEDLELDEGEPYPNVPRLSGNAIRLALMNAMRAAEDKGCNLNLTVALGFISQGVLDGKASVEDLLANHGAPPLQNLHQDPITALAFMPLDEQPVIQQLDEVGIQGVVVVASASGDRTVRLWCYDRMGDATVHILRQHTAEVTCVSWSPDGHILVSGGMDGSIVVWRITLDPVYELPRSNAGEGGFFSSTNHLAMLHHHAGDIHGGDGGDGQVLGPDGSPLGPLRVDGASSGGGVDANGVPLDGRRLVSCVPIVVQNCLYSVCFDSGPIPNSLEPIFCLEFWSSIAAFGRNREYTLAAGTSHSLIVLRVHDMRVHQSPLTDMPTFLGTVRKFNRHARHLIKDPQRGGDDEDEEEHDEEEKTNDPYATKKGVGRGALAFRGLRGGRFRGGGLGRYSSSSSSKKRKTQGLRSNYLRVAILHRHVVDSVRYGAVRSLSVGIHEIERHMAYDLEDSLDASHMSRDLQAISERQVKLLVSSHENQGHVLVWVLNEDVDQRTTLPTLIPRKAVLGHQNDTEGDDNEDSAHGGGSGPKAHFGNYCEQVALPTPSLRRKLERSGVIRADACQHVCFTLNAQKSSLVDADGYVVDAAAGGGGYDEGHSGDPDGLLAARQGGDDNSSGSGIRSWKFSVEASSDSPGDIEPTISSRRAYMKMLRESIQIERLHLSGRLNVGTNKNKVVLLDADGLGDDISTAILSPSHAGFIGRLSHTHAKEYDMPSSEQLISPAGVPPNEEKRLRDYQARLGVTVFKYPEPRSLLAKVVGSEASGATLQGEKDDGSGTGGTSGATASSTTLNGREVLDAARTRQMQQSVAQAATAQVTLALRRAKQAGGGRKVLSTNDTSGFATSGMDDDHHHRDATGGTSSSSSSSHSSSKGDPGLASSKHLVGEIEEEVFIGNLVRRGHNASGYYGYDPEENVEYTTFEAGALGASKLERVETVAGLRTRKKVTHLLYKRAQPGSEELGDDDHNHGGTPDTSSIMRQGDMLYGDGDDGDDGLNPTDHSTSIASSSSRSGKVHWRGGGRKHTRSGHRHRHQQQSNTSSSVSPSSSSASTSTSSLSSSSSRLAHFHSSLAAAEEQRRKQEEKKKKDEGLFSRGGGSGSTERSNKEDRAQCATPGECLVQ